MKAKRRSIETLVESFAAKMLDKLTYKRDMGWTGWGDRRRKGQFERRLLEHARRAMEGERGQWVDVANFAAFLDAMEPDE